MREIACGGGKGNTGLFIELNAACCCCCTRNPYCSLFNLNQFIFCSVAKYVIIKCDDTSQIMKWYRKKCLEIKNEAKPNTNRRSPLFRNTLSQNNRFRLFRILFFFLFLNFVSFFALFAIPFSRYFSTLSGYICPSKMYSISSMHQSESEKMCCAHVLCCTTVDCGSCWCTWFWFSRRRRHQHDPLRHTERRPIPRPRCLPSCM